MLIDWFTVVAQIINFLILVALLNHFLFKPILKNVDQRKQELQDQKKHAEEENQKAQEKKKEYGEKLKQIDQKEQELMEKAREEAENEKAKLIEAARNEVEKQKEHWTQELEKKAENQKEQISKEMETTVFIIAEKILKEFADTDLQEKMMDTFLKKIEETDQNEIPDQTNTLEVCSTFEIGDQWKNKIGEQIKRRFNGKEIKYRQDQKLLGGLMVKADSYQLLWSPYHYLEDLKIQSREHHEG